MQLTEFSGQAHRGWYLENLRADTQRDGSVPPKAAVLISPGTTERSTAQSIDGRMPERWPVRARERSARGKVGVVPRGVMALDNSELPTPSPACEGFHHDIAVSAIGTLGGDEGRRLLCHLEGCTHCAALHGNTPKPSRHSSC